MSNRYRGTVFAESEDLFRLDRRILDGREVFFERDETRENLCKRWLPVDWFDDQATILPVNGHLVGLQFELARDPERLIPAVAEQTSHPKRLRC